MSGRALFARVDARFVRRWRAAGLRAPAANSALAARREQRVRARLAPGRPAAALRAALTSLALVACEQTDLVASYQAAPCTGDDCGPPAACSARSCAPLASQRGLCAAQTPSVQVGDSCDNSAQVTRYGLCACTDLVAPAALVVDAYDGTLARPAAGAAALGINGSLHAAQGGQIDGSLRATGRVSGGELSGERIESPTPPCACDEATLLDVAALVRAARDDNDNAALGLASAALTSLDATRELTLPCGRYFLNRISSSAALTIRAQGHVALFVEGNVELDEAFSLLPEPGARLEVFAAGELRVGGSFTLGGDPSGTARAALFSDARGTLNLQGTTSLVGTLHAPRAELVTAGNLEVYGSLFVRRAALEGDLLLHQDISLTEPVACEAP